MTAFTKGASAAWLPRLHSAAGVVPAAAFFALHVWINARAMHGRRSYDECVSTLQSMPARALAEAVFIGAPLLFHAGYGLLVILGRAPGAPEPPGAPAWSRSMQRATGLVAAVFIAIHLAAIRVPTLLGDLRPGDFYPLLTAQLSATTTVGIPAWGAAYLMGLAAVSYHLANGLSRFFLRLGMGESLPRRRVISLGTGLLGATLFFLGASTVVYFATGASLLGAALVAN